MNLSAMRRQSVPLHVEVASMIRHQIMSGSLKPGSQLPPLRELTGKFGVSLMTVKQSMDALVEEGLIERHSGRGTFVKKIDLPKPQTLKMHAELSQLQSMVEQLEVLVLKGNAESEIVTKDGIDFQAMHRIHTRDGNPFCCVNILLDNSIYKQAPESFEKKIAVTVLKELGITIENARQRITISYADFETAKSLDIPVNSPVFRVFREFFGKAEQLIYTADLIYPGDLLELDIEFTLDS